MTQWHKYFSSARRFFDPAAQVTPVPTVIDYIALHSAEDTSELFVAVGEALAAIGAQSDAFTVLFREPDTDRGQVFHSTHDGLDVGADLLLPASARERTDPTEATSNLRVKTDAGQRITVSALLPLQAKSNHYGYLLLHHPIHGPVEELECLSRHLGLALYNQQVNSERARHQSLDALKVSMMLQTNVVLRELDLERALARLMELTVTTVKGEVGCIALTTQQNEALELRAEWGIDSETFSQLRTRDGRSLGDIVALDGMLCLFRNRAELEELAPCEPLERIHSLVALPVESGNGVRGCIVIANAPNIDGDDVELLKMVTDVCSTAIDNALRHRHSMERESLREQLRLAGDIQQGLLPPAPPSVDGVAVAGHNVPADDSSGDYYDFFVLDERKVGFVIADATGHGIGAALIATTARSALRALLHQRRAEELNLADILLQLNELAESDFNDDKFITLFIGIYDAERRTLHYASAGHNPPMLVHRQRSGEIEHLDATGLPLGMFPGMTYDAAEITDLEPGDLMLVMTDGVNEASNASGEQFGLDRVEQLMRDGNWQSPKELINRIGEQLEGFTGDRPREDDITMVCVRCEALAEQGAAAQPAAAVG
jgi:serine phosphatase RsbU (regulator of sigma subunit)